MEGYDYFEVIAGAHDPFDSSEETQQRQIVYPEDVTIHEGYSIFTLDDDIAIIRLSEPLVFNGSYFF